MAQLSWVPRISIEAEKEVIPTITASSAYTAGNQVGGIMSLTDLLRFDSNMSYGSGLLTSVTIIDAAKQALPFYLLFFKTSPTLLSTDKTAFSQTAANAKLQLIGSPIPVGSSYITTTSYSISQGDTNLNFPVYSRSGSSIYVVAITSGTPTYTSTSDLQFMFNFLLD